MTGAPPRRILLTAAAAGILTAFVLTLLLEASGGSVGPQDPDPTSTTTAITTGSTAPSLRPSEAGSTTTTPVTVGVPRADEEAAPDLAPPSLPPDTAPAPVEPITDPEQAATAYLVAAETVTGDDAGRRHRRAEPYVSDENPTAAAGVLVTDPPPPGSSRTIEVVSATEWARNDGRIAYQVTYQPYLSPTIPAGGERTADGGPRVTYVVVAQEPEGHWLVTLHSASLDPVE
jgi:hypothetical protein